MNVYALKIKSEKYNAERWYLSYGTTLRQAQRRVNCVYGAWLGRLSGPWKKLKRMPGNVPVGCVPDYHDDPTRCLKYLKWMTRIPRNKKLK